MSSFPTSPESIRKEAKGIGGGEGIIYNQDKKLSLIPWLAQCSSFWPPLVWPGFVLLDQHLPSSQGLVHNQLEISLAKHRIPVTSEKVGVCRAGA